MAETVFTLAFLLEILIRMFSQRKQLVTFFKDKMNFTDFIIAVVTSIIQIPAIKAHHLVYVWFTGFQVLRIYRLVVAVPRLRSLMVYIYIYILFIKYAYTFIVSHFRKCPWSHQFIVFYCTRDITMFYYCK
jgi:hypothetical protein